MIWDSRETSAPNGRVTARVIPVRSATSGARIAADDVDRDGQGQGEPLGVGQGQRLGDELPEDDGEQRQQDRDGDQGDPGGRVVQGRDLLEQAGQPIGQADRGIGRGEEAQERQPELGDGQEPAGVVEEAADPSSAAVALLEELLDPAAADRHQGDLGRDEERPPRWSGG